MTHRTDDSFEAEEIVELRMKLFRANSKLEEQEKIVQRAEFYQQVLAKLIDVLSDRTSAIQQLGSTLGIKTTMQRDYNELKGIKIGKESDRAIFGRLQKLNLQLDVQEELLGRINLSVTELMKNHQEIKTKFEAVCKEHTNCGQIGSIATQHLEKFKQIEKVIEQKDASILQLQKMNQSLEEQIHLSIQQKQESLKQLHILQKEMQLKNREIEDNRDIVESAQESDKQKQRILDNCEKLLEIISIPQDDYLKYYFRSNGLPLDPPRQQKNKYSIVFDN